MTEYRRYAIVDGKPGCIIVNEDGHVTNKYPNKDELKGLNIEKYKIKNAQYTDKELLNFLKLFYEENGRIPLQADFVSNPGYPGYSAYQKRFGSWNNALVLAELGTRQKDKQYTDGELLNFLRFFYEKNETVPTHRYFRRGPNCPSTETYRKRFGSWNKALKLTGMDADTIVEQGILQNEYHKGRLWEILITNMLGNRSIDLSGNNCCNTFDGICPNGQTYEAKSAGLNEKNYWGFGIGNRDKEDDKEAIEWYYFGAFNKDYTELLRVWRVPGEVVDGNRFRIGLYGGKFTVENMQKYEITEEFKKLLMKSHDVKKIWKNFFQV